MRFIIEKGLSSWA